MSLLILINTWHFNVYTSLQDIYLGFSWIQAKNLPVFHSNNYIKEGTEMHFFRLILVTLGFLGQILWYLMHFYGWISRALLLKSCFQGQECSICYFQDFDYYTWASLLYILPFSPFYFPSPFLPWMTLIEKFSLNELPKKV